MKNVKIKLISILIIALILITLGMQICMARNVDVTEHPYDYRPGAISNEDGNIIKGKTGTILGIINAVGIIISVIAIACIGIKYMLGSVEDKAEYKKTLIPYMIGVALLVMCTTIPNIIYKIVIPTLGAQQVIK